MNDIDTQIEKCQKRISEYMMVIKDIDLMRTECTRNIAMETMNIEMLKKKKENKNNGMES